MKGGDGMNECRKDEQSPVCIPFFAHENTMMHYNTANKRMLIALITVCITFILTIIIFVSAKRLQKNLICPPYR